MSDFKIIIKKGRPFRLDLKTGRSQPIDIDPRIVQQTGLSHDEMVAKTEDNDNDRSMDLGLTIKENDSDE